MSTIPSETCWICEPRHGVAAKPLAIAWLLTDSKISSWSKRLWRENLCSFHEVEVAAALMKGDAS